MAETIQLLPDHIANQIAAGEVIQRPASAVKEMMENAIDSRATKIRLIIKDAGKALIQVVDDGCGMSDTDARLSFARHATSKIRNIEDLFSIRTMGFRGEALASIAAVAHVEMKTRKCDDELGVHLIIEGSEIKKQEPCSTPEGTSISIKNLFFNVPARRNFLKSNPVETRHIIDEFQRIALAHPDKFFSMHHNGTEVFHLNAGNLRQRIVGIFGTRYNQRLVPAEENTDILQVHGFIGKPDTAKKTRGEQFFFVNGRYIKNPYLNHAVVTAYEQILPEKSYPLYVLFIELDPERIDINVHPTKQEIKFDDERLVYTFVNAAVKHALAAYSVTPELDFEQEQGFGRLEAFKNPPRAGSEEAAAATSRYNTQGAHAITGSNDVKHWEKLYEIVQPGNKSLGGLTVESKGNDAAMFEEEFNESRVEAQEKIPTQLHNRYIISQIKSGFILIDQQAAHERILYERYASSLEQKQSHSQKLLFPVNIELAPADAALMQEILADINDLGFELQEFGKHTFVCHGVPAEITGQPEQELIEGLMEHFKENMRGLQLDKRENLARSFARNAGIKAGNYLKTPEMQALIDELFACKMPYHTPSGQPTFITFNMQDLEKQFQQKNSH